MANFANVIKKFRDIFNIAADVKDSEINKVIQEADKLDIKQGLCGDTFIKVPASFGGGLDGGDIPDSSTSDDAYSLLTWVRSLTRLFRCPRSCVIMPLHDTSRMLIRKAHPRDSRFPDTQHR